MYLYAHGEQPGCSRRICITKSAAAGIVRIQFIGEVEQVGIYLYKFELIARTQVHYAYAMHTKQGFVAVLRFIFIVDEVRTDALPLQLNAKTF